MNKTITLQLAGLEVTDEILSKLDALSTRETCSPEELSEALQSTPNPEPDPEDMKHPLSALSERLDQAVAGIRASVDGLVESWRSSVELEKKEAVAAWLLEVKERRAAGVLEKKLGIPRSCLHSVASDLGGEHPCQDCAKKEFEPAFQPSMFDASAWPSFRTPSSDILFSGIRLVRKEALFGKVLDKTTYPQVVAAVLHSLADFAPASASLPERRAMAKDLLDSSIEAFIQSDGDGPSADPDLESGTVTLRFRFGDG